MMIINLLLDSGLWLFGGEVCALLVFFSQFETLYHIYLCLFYRFYKSSDHHAQLS